MPTSSGPSKRPPHKRLNPSTPLGPQCVRCRRRRVKCDSTTPQCQRCERDNLECPGYGAKAATWTVKTPATMATQRANEGNGALNSVVLLSRKSNATLGVGSGGSSPSTSSGFQPGSGPRTVALASLDMEGQSSLGSFDPDSSTSCLVTNSTKSRKNTAAPILSHLWDPLLSLLTPVRPTTPSMTAADREAFLLYDCLVYYNKLMRPFLVGALLPNQSRSFRLSDWANIPPLMKHNTVYAMTAHRIARGEDHPDVQMQLHVHRGRTMELLREALALMGRTTWGALVLIVMFLGGELGISAIGGWETHYDAAWAVLESQGGEGGVDEGIRICWTLGEEPQLVCVCLLQIEIFSGTTAPVWTLAAARDRRVLHNLQRDDLGDIENRFLISTCPCPLQIAAVVAEINDLRSASYGLRINGRTAMPGHDGMAWSQRLWHVLTQLLCFQAEPWVNRILKGHETQVTEAETEGGFDRNAMTHSWTVLANCYRSAAIVYLIRACSSRRLSKALPDECKDFFNDAEDILDEHRRKLSDGLDFLIEGFTTSRRDLKRPVLWRFIFWPLFVNAYESVGWSSDVNSNKRNGNETHEGTNSHQDALIQRHRRLGKELGATCLFEAANLLQDVQRQREIQLTWDWDDAFPKRVVFSL